MKQHTNEEIMEFFDIKPGDRFEYLGDIYVVEDVLSFSYYVKCRDDKSLAFTTCEEVQEKIKPLPRVAKFGDNICGSTYCENCPLSKISCQTDTTNTENSLLEIYQAWVKETGYHVPEIEEELNEEVEE